MPNHYVNVAICAPGYDFKPRRFEADHKDTNFCELVRPRPVELTDTVSDGGRTVNRGPDGEPINVDGHNSWYSWCNAKWGTKWGTYGAKAKILDGDGSPVVLSFQSAWCPPNDEILNLISEWLNKEHKFTSITWLGFDPYDYSTKVLIPTRQFPSTDDK